MKIRQATTDDVEGMKKVLIEAFHDSYIGAGEFYSSNQFVDPNYATSSGSYYDLKALLEDNLNNIGNRLEEPFKAFVAVDNELIGYAITEKHKGKLWINDLVVKPGKQKKGIGKKLFEAVTKNHDQVYIWVNSKNPAIKFWENLGFSTILEEKLMMSKLKKIE